MREWLSGLREASLRVSESRDVSTLLSEDLPRHPTGIVAQAYCIDKSELYRHVTAMSLSPDEERPRPAKRQKSDMRTHVNEDSCDFSEGVRQNSEV